MKKWAIKSLNSVIEVIISIYIYFSVLYIYIYIYIYIYKTNIEHFGLIQAIFSNLVKSFNE